MSTGIEIVDPRTDGRWDEAIKSRGNASVFHTSAWAKVLCDTWSYTPYYFLATEDSYLKALFPVVEVDSWLTGCRGISLPFTDECNGIAEDPDDFQSVLDEIIQCGKKAGWEYLELRGGRSLPADATASLCYYGHTIDLRGGEDALFARCKGNVRTAVRSALNQGVGIEVSDSLDALRVYYALHSETRREHGLPPQPFGFFRSIQEHLFARNMGFVVLASLHGQIVAGAVFLRWGKRAVYKYAAAAKKAQALRGSNIVLWEAMRWLAREGCEELSMGKTSIEHEGLRRFKLGWGAEEYAIPYYKYDLRKDSYVRDRDQIQGWYNRIFRMMPAPLLRATGSALYRHIA